MDLKLTDEQTEALIRELSQIVQNDRYPFSPRMRVLKTSSGSYGRRLLARRRCPRYGTMSHRARGGIGDEGCLSEPLPGHRVGLVLLSADRVSLLAFSPRALFLLPDDHLFGQLSECREHSTVNGHIPILVDVGELVAEAFGDPVNDHCLIQAFIAFEHRHHPLCDFLRRGWRHLVF